MLKKTKRLTGLYCEVQPSKLCFRILLKALLLKQHNLPGPFYFNIADVDNLWESLKDNVKICYEIATFEWGMREFAIYDNNGYVLQFGEKI